MESLANNIRHYYQEVDQSTYRQGQYFKTRAEAIDAIMSRFDPAAIYDREGSPRFSDRDAIAEFFSEQRGLIGSHHVRDIKEMPGIALGEHECPPNLDGIPASECTTVTVHGTFHGTLCKTSGEDRKILHAQPANLSFTDYWVAHGETILYRLSEISPLRKITPVSRAPMQY